MIIEKNSRCPYFPIRVFVTTIIVMQFNDDSFQSKNFSFVVKALRIEQIDFTYISSQVA